MLRVESDADQTRVKALERREAPNQPKQQRKSELLRAARQRTSLESGLDRAILDGKLQALGQASRKNPPLLHLSQIVVRQAPFAEWSRQNVCGGDGVLHCKVNPDAANR